VGRHALVVTAPAVVLWGHECVLGRGGGGRRGTSRHIGDVRPEYADFATGGATVDAVRLTWASGSPALPVDEDVTGTPLDPSGQPYPP
jgi:hypothetical protein